MKLEMFSKEMQQKWVAKLNEAKGKEEASQAMYEVIAEMTEVQNEELIQKIVAEARQAEVDKEYMKSLGLRTLSKEETTFYNKLIDPKQAITFTQEDILPNSIIDNTLNDVKKESKIAKLIKFAPANVKQWLSASKTGEAVWGKLDASITGELSATFKMLPIELHKLTVYMVIPKAIKDLALPFVDRYFSAILKEAMNDGIEKGFIDGDGASGPAGIMRTVNYDAPYGAASAKTVNQTLEGFSPKQLAPVKKLLCKGGLRTVETMYLICHPEDEAEYVDPALYAFVNGAYVQTSKTNIEVIPSANCAKGKAVLTIANAYTMGFSGFKFNEYTETKALEDANLLIGKVYGNGLPDDNNTAYVFNVTKLKEFIPQFQQVGAGTPA